MTTTPAKTPAPSRLARMPARWRRALLAGGLATTSVLAIGISSLGTQLDYEIGRRTNFFVREKLGHTPPVHPKLKIFGYDDPALAEYKTAEISIADWTKLFTAMGARQPRAIIVDKMFGFVPDEGLFELQSALAKHPIVSSGAFVHDYLIRSRPTLDLTRRDFRLELIAGTDLSAADWIPDGRSNAYGPDARLASSFAHIGHILYPGHGEIAPLLRVNANTFIPHVTLFAGGALRVTRDGLTIGGRDAPVDGRGHLHVNFPRVRSLLESIYSMTSTIHFARQGRPLAKIEEGDVVLVLPQLFTGNTDILDTPVGRVPGGLILASVINSILNDEWLTPIDALGPLVVATGALGLLLGAVLGPVMFWPVLMAVVSIWIAIGLGLFTFLGVVVPWFFPSLALALSGVAAYALNIIAWAAETRRMRDALHGAVPEAKLKAILSGRGQLKREASERVVTLMFLDIANFSVFAEQTPPRQVFLHLKDLLRDVTKVIHRYGGTVDKTLGDGLLCFFGYSYDGEVSENQADQAIRCAVEIQRENIVRCIEAAKAGGPLLPFRIGINTSSIYIGDLGDEGRIDFTVIGNGVNYAQRLESNCDHHSIMLSGTSIDFSAHFGPRMPGFKKRFIHIKHHDELLEAMEYDPFHDRTELREEALKEFRRSYNLERKEQRWPVSDASRLEIESEFGKARLIDFSASGLCVRLDSYLSKGVSVALTLTPSDAALRQRLVERGISILKTEVRWGKATEDGYAHGLKFANLSDIQQTFLFAQLREAFSAQKDAQAS